MFMFTFYVIFGAPCGRDLEFSPHSQSGKYDHDW